MTRLNLLLLWISLPVALHLHAQHKTTFDTQALAAISLRDIRSDALLQAARLNNPAQLRLFIFLSPECPISQYYIKPLNDFARSYPDVRLIAVFPGKAYSRNLLNDFLRKYDVRFEAYLDEDKSLTRYLDASVTPEVVLVSGRMTLQYRGAIDDRMKGLGVRKIRTETHYLKNAIDESLLHKEVAVKFTKPVGCLINDF